MAGGSNYASRVAWAQAQYQASVDTYGDAGVPKSKLILTEEAKDVIIERGSSLEFGARPLRRAIENLLEDPLSENVLRGDYDGKNCITVRAHEENGEKKLVFESTGAPPAEPAPAVVGGEQK